MTTQPDRTTTTVITTAHCDTAIKKRATA